MKRVTPCILAFLLLLTAACAGNGETENTAISAGGSSNESVPAASSDVTPTPADSSNIEPTPTAAINEAQIYAAAIRQIYTVDHSFGESPGWTLVYLVTTTDDSTMFDGPVAPAQTLSAELQQAITAGLSDLPFEVIWVAGHDEVPIDSTNGQVAGGEGIIVSLGNIHPQDDGSVQLPFFMTCGGLCGIGKTYVLTQANGLWSVTGSVGPEIMS
jgi:hypothetical protein